ncbi:MAG TPA: AMP-binding protein [Candidatus Kryptonia bacterium]|nr:AMP-binding protein [Candidatus Kryptonia bacterium]
MDSNTAPLPNAAPAPTMAAALRARVADSADRVFLRFDDARWTFAETYRVACRYANLFLRHRDVSRPFHVGVLMDNLPEFIFTQSGCALAGAALVGLNPTRTGEFLARDIGYADCQLIVVEPRYAAQLHDAVKSDPTLQLTVFVASAEIPPGPPFSNGGTFHPGWEELTAALASVSGDDPNVAVEPTDLLMIIFTSGTTKAPKGVLNSHGRLMMLGWGASLHMCRFTPDDTVYSAMPLYHANAQILALIPALSAGGGIALARRFSKTNFLADIRRYHATLFNYVGTPFAYIMDTPARPDDADNPLRLAYGNEAPRQYIEAFAQRFGCEVIDGYGASEVGVGFAREAGDPARSLGRAEGVKILNEQGEACPAAQFDDAGHLLNADAAVGEIVNTGGVFMFEGYYKDAESTQQRTRNGWFHTGDLGYRDADGFIYFAGRDAEWLRVGGENFLARPIEDSLSRYPDAMLASVYGVPDPEAGDQVMVTIALQSGAAFDPAAFTRFVDGAANLPPRWRPTFVRVAREVVVTHTNKVLKRVLKREGFRVDRFDDPVYWRPRGANEFRRFTRDDLAALRTRFEQAGYADRLEG